MKEGNAGFGDILDFAISKEEEAAAFYDGMALKVDTVWMKKVFSDFADEERKHREKLLGVKKGMVTLGSEGPVPTLDIADYLVEENTKTDEFIYQDALALAMLREKAAFKLYSDLSEKSSNPEIKALFAGLAQEEAKHKLRFELEYDQYVLTEN